GGKQKMIAIARALMTDPALLLLDEPSEGLSPLIVRILVDALVRIREGGVTVLAADQNLQFARAIADRALVMERGRIVHSATREDLARNDPALQRLLAVGRWADRSAVVRARARVPGEKAALGAGRA